MILAVIPARAGSKGISGKNTQLVNGKPLVQWSIDAALASPLVDRVVVSSNCPEVKKITEASMVGSENLHFLQRPEEISGDKSKTEEALFHVLEWAVEAKAWGPDWIMTLQPTSPVRNNRLIDKCCQKVIASDHYDSLMTCSAHTPFFYTAQPVPIRNSDNALLRPSVNLNCAVPLDHNPCRRPMRQEIGDWEMLYHDAGNVFMTKASRLLMYRCRTGKQCALMPLTNYQAWQIDRSEDVVILESMSKAFGPFVDS